MSRYDELDLLDLAEDVAAGRLRPVDAEDRVRAAAGIDGERAADAAVRQLTDLIRAAEAVRAHASATHAAAAQAAAGVVGPVRFGAEADGGAGRPVPVAGRVSPRRSIEGPDRSSQRGLLLLAAALAVIGGVAAAALFGGRLVAPSPEPSGSAIAVVPSASTSPSPLETPSPSAPHPSASPTPAATPLPAPAATGIPSIASTDMSHPGVVVWRLSKPDQIDVLAWRSPGILAFDVRVAAWPDPGPLPGGVITRQVLAAPVGSRIAVAETDPQAKTRVRVVDWSGHVLWTTSSQAGIPALAWSADGTELAVAFVPAPWIVVTFQTTGTADATTYDMPGGGVPLQLLGFSADGNRLFGYDGSGEAALWERPYTVDLVRGVPAAISRFPGSNGVALSNTTTLSALVDAQTGDVLDRGDLSGRQTTWSIMVGARRTDTHVPLVEDNFDTGLAWGPNDGLVSLSKAQPEAASGTIDRVVVSELTRSGQRGPTPPWSPGEGSYRGFLRGVRDGWALIGLSEYPARADESLGDDELVLLQLSTSQTVTFEVGGPGSFDLHVAGFLTEG